MRKYHERRNLQIYIATKLINKGRNHKERQHRKKKIMPAKLRNINLERHSQDQLGGQN